MAETSDPDDDESVATMSAAVSITALYEERAPYRVAGEATEGETSGERAGALVPFTRPFTRTDNLIYEVMPYLGGSAFMVLMAIQRQTVGYRRETTTLTLSDLERMTSLARHTIIQSLTRLTNLGLIHSDAATRSRTQTRAYTWVAPEQWDIAIIQAPPLPPTKSTSAKNALVTRTPSTTSAKSTLVTAKTSAKNALDGLETSAKNAPRSVLKKVNSKERVNERKTSAAAPAAPSPLALDTLVPTAPSEVSVLTATTDTTPEVPAAPATPTPSDTPAASLPPTAAKPTRPAKSPKADKPPKAPRELSPDHQYRVDLLAAIEQANGGLKPPNRDREWAAAGKLFARSAGAAPIEQVVACYALERQRPRWDSEYLSLTHLLSHYDVYVRNPTNYARAIDRARAAADGVYDQSRETRDERRDETRDRGNSHAAYNQDGRYASAYRARPADASGGADDASDDAVAQREFTLSSALTRGNGGARGDGSASTDQADQQPGGGARFGGATAHPVSSGYSASRVPFAGQRRGSASRTSRGNPYQPGEAGWYEWEWEHDPTNAPHRG